MKKSSLADRKASYESVCSALRESNNENHRLRGLVGQRDDGIRKQNGEIQRLVAERDELKGRCSRLDKILDPEGESGRIVAAKTDIQQSEIACSLCGHGLFESKVNGFVRHTCQNRMCILFGRDQLEVFPQQPAQTGAAGVAGVQEKAKSEFGIYNPKMCVTNLTPIGEQIQLFVRKQIEMMLSADRIRSIVREELRKLP